MNGGSLVGAKMDSKSIWKVLLSILSRTFLRMTLKTYTIPRWGERLNRTCVLKDMHLHFRLVNTGTNTTKKKRDPGGGKIIHVFIIYYEIEI